MPRIKIVKTPKKSKLNKYQINGQVMSDLASTVSNITNPNIIQGLVNSGTYNPFDIKWGQERVNPPVDLTGGYTETNKQLNTAGPIDRLATSSNEGKLYPTIGDTPIGGKGVLDTSKLIIPVEPAVEKQKTPVKNPNDFNKTLQNLRGVTQSIQQGLALGSLFANKKEADRARQDARRKFQQAPVFGGRDMGQYTTTGLFRPNQYTSNLGMYTNKLYPTLDYAKEGMTVEGDRIVKAAFIPDLPPAFLPGAGVRPSSNIQQTTVESRPEQLSSTPASNSYVFEPTPIESGNKAVEILSSVQAKLESGYDPTKPPTSKQNLKSWNLPASKTIYGKYQVSQDERKEAYKNLSQLKNTFPTFQEYNDAFLGKINPELQKQVQEITYKNYIAPRNLKLAGGDIYAAALYHYLPAAAKLYSEGKLDLNLKPGQLFPNNKMLVAADKVNPTFGSYLSRFKKEYERQKEYNLFETGGENNNTMKIKIVGTPDENKMAYGGQAPYSGQSDYGLYIGQRNLYKTMAKNPYENVSNTVSEKEETPEDPYVLEAEGEETILRPDGTHDLVVGPSHARDGVKLTKSQAPEGSFIFSKTRSMKIKDPNILKLFGKQNTKGGATPAELVKPFNVNKYKAILADPNASELSKSTAQKMIENYSDMFAIAALAQEGKKGFPKGIPDVAKQFVAKTQPQQQSQEQTMPPQAAYGGMFGYGGINIPDDPEYMHGGLTIYQTKGEVSEEIRKAAKPITDKTKVGPDYKYLGKADQSEYWGRTIPGQAGQTVRTAVPGGRAGTAWENWIKDQLQKGVSIEELAKKGHGTIAGLQKYKDYYKAPTAAVSDYLVYQNQEENKTPPVIEEKPKGDTEPEPPVERIQPGTFNPTGGRAFNAGRPPFFSYDMFVIPEQEKIFAAPRRKTIPTPVYYDPTRELAESASLARQFTQGYTGTPQGYSAANLAGNMQLAERAGNIIGSYANKNVGVGTQADMLRSQIMNQDIAENAERMDMIGYNTEQARKAYRSNLIWHIINLINCQE